jgi:hypothetical protein
MIEIAILLAFAGGAIFGYKLGWNSVCRMGFSSAPSPLRPPHWRATASGGSRSPGMKGGYVWATCPSWHSMGCPIWHPRRHQRLLPGRSQSRPSVLERSQPRLRLATL